jgi:hypothetical protein
MSPTLTPLPSQHPGIAPASAGAKTWNVLPFPQPHHVTASAPQPAPLPAWPSANSAAATDFPKTWPSPLSVLPSATSVPLPDTTQPQIESPTSPVSIPSNETDFTDDDLRIAFSPIVEEAVRKAVYAKENGIDTYLEPMLRATIRRALAEYAPASRPFQQPGAMDRFIWHVQALFTSRTYEDIFFEKTRRFQVEEVFLLDAASLALVSYASCDPARHSAVRRVSGTVQRLALQLRDDDKKIRTTFELSDKRSVISREGSDVVLMALVRGTPGELLFADLEFALRRIEDHFREQFRQQGSNLLFSLQPFLEDCLLIQSPASAA